MLQKSIDSYEFPLIHEQLNHCSGVDICAKVRRAAEVLHQKLEHELLIDNFLKSHQFHENYKDIRKDVQKVNQMLEDAQSEEIELDSLLVNKVNEYTSTIISERNLRKQRDLFLEAISTCDQEKVEKLQNLIDVANKNAVDKQYIDSAEVLSGQMSGNILARETLQMLLDYPERAYPDLEEVDPKKKAKKEDKKKAPAKKKRKREPAFNTPEWASDIAAVVNKVKNMEQLSADKNNLKLDEEFIKKVQE